MRRFAALAICVGVLATVYVAACILPGEPSGAERIQFTLDSTPPYHVPIAGVLEPLIVISANGHVLENAPYRLETLDASVVGVDSTQRRLLGVKRGTVTVRVTYLGATGTPDTVFPVRVVISRVAVDSPALTFTRLGVRTRLSAVALDANDAAVPNVPFTWSTADATVATVNDTGFVTAVNDGTTKITAEADGVTDASNVTVTQVAAAVRVTPELDTLRAVGRSIQLVALALDANNNFLFSAKPHWTSSDTNVARVDSAGRATATGGGTGRIIARVGAAADTATLVVAQVARLVVLTPGFDTLTALAETARLVAVVLDSSLIFPIPTPSMTWTTSDATIATVDQTGLVRAVNNGAVLVTATSGGQSAFATVVVRQEVATTRVSQDSAALTGVGDTVRLSAVGLDKNGYPVAGGVWVSWRSASGCVASLATPGFTVPPFAGPSALVTARGAGETAIIAQSAGGQPDTAAVSVTGAPAGEPEIAFMSYSGIEALCSVGGYRTQLIPNRLTWVESDSVFRAGGPAWSPDGARLAFWRFTLFPSLDCGIYVARADGSQPQRVADGCGRPAWSPDGTKLAFSPGNTDTIYVVNADGSNVRPLSALGPGRSVSDPTWSPDGTHLAFDAGGNIYIMNADGSGVHMLNTAYGGTSAWSPDGSQLAFALPGFAGRQSDIVLIHPDGSGARNLTTNGLDHYATEPAWSPDGSRLVFAQADGVQDWETCCIRQLFVINRDGTGLHQLNTDGWDADYPAWRPVAPPP